MKRNIFYLFALAFTIMSCNKVLDVKPTDSVAAEDAIQNKAGVEHALIGSYHALQATGLYYLNAMVVGDIAADNLTHTGTMMDYSHIENKPIPAENAIVEGMWSGAYNALNCVNNILVKLPGIEGLTQDEYNQYEGEALFIRGLMHYYLVTYFGGVPIQTMPTLDLSRVEIARNTEAEVYAQIITDLTTAKAKLSKTKVKGRANKYAASALLAKVYLSKFQILGDQPSANLAITESSYVIDSAGYALATDYASLLNTKNNTNESIFEVVFDAQNFTRLAQYYFSRNLSGRYEFAPEAELIQSFEPADTLRLAASIAYDTVTNQPYGFKYKDVSGGTDHVYVLRLAEMYLIKAEALAYSGGDIKGIQNNINAIRHRAGIDSTTVATIPELKLVIENECRHEFAFEGHRWLDLVRTKRAVAVLGINEKYTLFPIPLSEKQTNNLMEQNPGY